MKNPEELHSMSSEELQLDYSGGAKKAGVQLMTETQILST